MFSAYYPTNSDQWSNITFAVMAIFERTSQTRAILDDTEKLTCVVENAQNINKHTVSSFFVMKYSRSRDGDCCVCPTFGIMWYFDVFRSIHCESKRGRAKSANGRFPVGTGTSRRCTRAFSRRTSNYRSHRRNILETCNHLLWLKDK